MNEASKPWVLVVEDDFENQKFLKIFLQRRFNVDVCDSADTCYEQLAKHEFDLLIMDISLRGKKDGLQLTKELRSSDNYKNLPIVCLSAHAFQRDKDNAYNAGVDVFITKPVQNHILLAAILKVLKDRRGIDLE
ncbi:MAG: response regulator [Melioribacteraceae bacterium]|jgi:DNA-binding response OmpR family regulator|nr:response regulator [Melioribacteraceae bacterium]